MVRWLRQGGRAGGRTLPGDGLAITPYRRVWLRRLAAAAGAMFLLVMPLVAMAAPEPQGGGPGAPASLSDDDAGHAMFNLAAMAPGRSASRCVVVAYQGPAASPVSLRASGGGSLDGYLGMVVEMGSGGGYSNCAGFSGNELYRGTLAGFLSKYGSNTSGLTTWAPANGASARTFKFTFTLPDDMAAAGRTAKADFQWQVEVPVNPVESLPPADPEAPPADPEIPADPGMSTDTDPVGSDLDTTADQTEVLAAPPTTIGSSAPVKIGAHESGTPEKPLVIRPKVVAADDVGTTAAAKGRKPVPATVLSQLEQVVGKFVSGVATVAPPVLKRSAFPVTLVALVVGFIGLQNRIDRNDPKLDLAPLTAEPDLTFDQ